jgi:hypothetical protein
MRARYHQRPNRGEGPCVSREYRERNEHKVPPAYSPAEDCAGSLNGRRDDDLKGA